jgi:hypothetical protein
MHRSSGHQSHEAKVPPPPLSGLRAGGSVQAAIQSEGSNAAETRGFVREGLQAARVSMAIASGPLGAGQGLTSSALVRVVAGGGDRVGGLGSLALAMTGDPSCSLTVHPALSYTGHPCTSVAAQVPIFPMSKQAQRETIAKGTQRKFRTQPR